MGYPWKMFTSTQGQELIDNTTSQWTTINGKNGRKFINKSDSSKYIFLPAAGIYRDMHHDYDVSSGDYWSTTWYSASYPWYMDFHSGNVNMKRSSYRYYGYSIRSIRPLKF